MSKSFTISLKEDFNKRASVNLLRLLSMVLFLTGSLMYSPAAQAQCNAGDDVTICLPKTKIKLADPGTGQSWTANASNPAGAIVATTGEVTGMTAVGTYTFILSDGGTCNDDIIITVNAATEYKLCADESFLLTVQPGVTNVQWQKLNETSGEFDDIPGENGIAYEATEIGVYSYTALDSEGCEAELCCPVTIVEGDCCITPDAGDDLALCVPTTSADLVDAGTDQVWSAAPGNPAAATINPSTGVIAGMTAAGDYEFILTNTAATITCEDRVTITITAQPTPTVNSPTICEGDPTTLTIAACAGEVQWLDGPITMTRTVSPPETTTYSFTCTENECESEQVDAVVTVIPKPNAGEDEVICETTSTFNLPDAAANQTWSVVSGTATIDATSGIVTGMNTNGDYVFRLSSTLAGCEDEVMISRKPQPMPTVNSPTICEGTSATLTIASCAGTVKWLDGPITMTRTASPTITTTYSFTCIENGCESEQVDAVVTVIPKPDAGADIGICAPIATVDLPNAIAGETWTADPANPAGGGTVATPSGIVSGMTGTGTFKYVLTGTSNGVTCRDTVSVMRGVQPTPTVNSPTICEGTSATLTIASCAGTVHWLDGPITLNRVVSPPVTTTYSFTCTVSGCESELVDAVVTVVPKPNAGPDVVICETTSTFDLPDAGTDQTWSVVSGTATINGTSGVVTGMNANGDYVFRLSPSPTFAGCTDEVMITRKPQPTPTVNSPTICEGSTATLTVAGCNGGTVRWSDASPLVIRPVSPTNSTTYTFTCTIDGCVSEPVVASVTVIPQPVAGPDREICEPMMGIDLPDAAANQTWSFVSGPATAAITTPGGVVTNMSANGDYVFKLASTLAGCEDMVTVSRKPQPKPTVNSPEICLGESATLTVENCNGTVLWTSGSTAMVRTVRPTNTTTPTTYSFVCTEDGCPSETITSTVTVNPLPVVTVTTPKIICDGTSVDLTATSNIPNSTFTWTGSAVTAPANTATISTAPAGSLQENKEYIYTVTATSPKGCKATTETKVTVTPSLRVNAGVDQTICEDGTTTLTATTNLDNSQTNGTVVITWSEAAGNPNSGNNLGLSTKFSVLTNALEIGEYVFIATSTQASPDGKTNCVITDEVKVTVLREPSITIEARDDSGIVTAVCNDGNSSVTLAATLSSDTPAAATIMWSSVQDPQLSYLSCTTCDNPTLTVPTSYAGATITYTAMATVTGDNNITCTDEAEITITINKAAVLTIIDPLVICDGTSVQLDVNSDKSVASYLWVGSPINDPTLKQPTVSSTGSLQENTIYTYTVQVEDIDGCVSEATTTVTVTPSIQVFAGSDKTICETDGTSLTATTNLMTSATNGTVIVRWTEAASNPSSGSNLAATTGYTVATNALAPGEYLFTATVTQTSPDGTTPCVHTDEIKVVVTQAPVISVTSTQPNICGKAQETITLEATLSTPAAATYTWSSTDDPTLAFLSCNQCDAPELTVPASYTGSTITYRVKAVVTTDNNLLCEDEAEITIIVNPALAITPIENVTVCDEYISETESRTATLKDATGADVNITSWTITPMVGITNVVVSGAEITFDVTPSNNQVEYTVTLTSAETCSAATKFWAYETARPEADFRMDASVCLESSIQVMFNGNAAPGATYTWDFAGATVLYSNDDNPYDGIAEGPGPHDIKWTEYPGFGNSYTVQLTVNDGGCEDIHFEDIDVNRGYEVEWTSTNTTACNANDGTISMLSALERQTNRDVAESLNFTWTSTNGFEYFAAYPDGANLTGLAPGTYHVRVDNGTGGCNYEYDIDILRPDNIGLNALVGYKATCGEADGGIHTEVVGGTAPYTFSYFDASSTLIETRTIADSIDYQYGLTEGKYTVIIEDSKGCSTTGDIIIDNADGPRVEIAGLVPTACGEDQGEMEFTIFGAAPFSYEIFASNPYPGGTVSQAGVPIKLEFLAADDYIMEVTDANGCVTIVKFTIMSNAPNFTIAVNTTEGTCEFNPNGSTNTPTGAFEVTSPIGGSFTYTWIGRDGQEFTPTTVTNPTTLATGTYKLIVSDGACVDSVDLVINPTDGPTPEVISTTNPSCPDINDGTVTFTVNKNPDTGQPDKNIYDLTNLGPFRYTLRNTTSQNGLVKSGQIEEATELTIEGLEEGTYVLTMTDRNDCVGYQTFTITDNPNFEILVDRENLEVCDANDGMITFSIIGAAGGTYDVTINPDEIVPSPFVEGVETSIFGMSADVDYEVTVTDANGCVATFPVMLTQPEVCFNCDLFAATDIESYDMICDETESGQVRVTVTGGTAPYIYKWYDATGTVISEGISSDTVNMVSGLMNGVYYVEVTDANECSFGGYETRYFAKVSQSGGPVVTITSNTPAACGGSDGSIRFQVTGVLDFIYSMTKVGETTALVTGDLVGIPNGTTVSSLEEGTYVLSVTDANGCTTTTVVDISSKVFPMNITETVTPPTCDGTTLGEIAIVLSPKAGQTAPAGQPVVTWSGPDGAFAPTDQMLAESLPAGIYTVTVTYPNGCTDSKDISLNSADGPTLSAVAQASVNCIGNEDGSFTLNADGNGQPIIGFIVKGVKSVGYDAPYPTTITDEVIDGLAAGEYIVEVIGFNGCISTAVVEITKPIEMNILIQPTPVDDCDIQNGTLTVSMISGGTSPFSIKFKDSVDVLTLPYTWTNLSGGDYVLEVTDADGCMAAFPVTVEDISFEKCHGTIGDFVWKDTDNDGVQDGDEEGVDDVKVILWSAVGGQPDTKLDSMLTKDGGMYLFDTLRAGDYIVQLDLTTIPDSCYVSDSLDKDGDDEKDNDFDSSTGLSPVVTLNPELGGIDKDNPTIDGALFTPYGSIGDFVWKDEDNDGIQDATEEGVENVTVELWTAVNSSPGVKLEEVMTTETGFYEFDSLLKGDYIVKIIDTTLPEGCYLSDSTNKGGNDEKDNDFNSATGLSPVVSLDPIKGGIDQDNPTIDGALFTPIGTIGDYVWKDTNDDGVQDTDEDGVNEVKVILWSADASGTPIMKLDSMMTEDGGMYEFDSLGKGFYLVQVDATSLPETCYLSTKQDASGDDSNDTDVDPTTGISQLIELDPIQGGILQDNPTIDAALFTPYGSIGDYVWKDTNDNGAQDTSEEGVKDVKVILWSANGVGQPEMKLDSMLTTATGFYEFDSLTKGDYLIQVAPSTVPEGCYISDMQDASGDDANDSDVDPTTGISQVVMLDPIQGGILQDNPTIDAGLKLVLGSISDYVWKDLNDDGIQDDDEEGVDGIIMNLWSADQSGNPVDKLETTTTADSGKYLFDELPAGRYIVQIDTQSLPEGCDLSDKENQGGDDTKDNDFDATDGLSPVVTLDPIKGGIDQDNPTIDAGLKSTLGSIGNYVWKDTNDDGIQDDDEAGVNGITVKLWSADQSGNPLDELKTTTTADGGKYLFDELPAGRYIVQIDTQTLPDGCELTSKANIGGDDKVDSDFDPTDGLSPVVTLNPVQGGIDKDNLTIDAGLVSPLGSIGDYVWKDANDNGIQDNGEEGVNGVTVKLWSADQSGNPDTELKETTTANGGGYTFTDLPAGEYIVQVVTSSLPADCELSDKVNEGGDDTKDNDFNPSTGLSPVVTLDPTNGGLDKDNPTIDAGLKSTLGSIGDFVWKDTNDNGIQDNGEAGVEDVNMVLWSADGSGNKVAILETATTNDQGFYEFTDLDAGRYIVEIDSQTLPDDCQLSDKVNAGGDDTKDNDFDPATGQSPVVTLDPAAGGLDKDNPTIDAGLVTTEVKGSIGDFVWKDTNDNGIQDGGEAGVNGVTVNLWSADASGNPVTQLATTTTANGGAYNFGDLDAGRYIVQIDTQTLPDGCDLSDKTNQGGDDTKDSDFNPTNGLSPVVTLNPENGGLAKDNPTIDAALVAPEEKGSIGDFVWKDTNDNGIQDGGEAGVNGVTVNLWSADASGNPVTQLATTTTANGGAYNFGDLDAGRYIVQIDTQTLPDGCDLSDKTNQGGDDTKDSDFDPTSGLSPVVTLNPVNGGLEKDNPSIDAAVVTPVTPGNAILNITKVVDRSVIQIGETVTYTISVWNTGTKDTTGVEVEEFLYAGAQLVSATPSSGAYNEDTKIWKTGDVVAGGAKETLVVVVRVIAGGNWLNSAVVRDPKIPIDPPTVCVSAIIPICTERGESLELSAPTGYATYQWYRNNQPISGAVSRTYVATEAGSYTVKESLSSGCPNDLCCPVIVADVCECPAEICIPITIKKSK
jgi:uncharacterized repeat protein (TIGR01451 family)